MATLIVLTIQGPRGDDGSMGVFVEESFEDCLNKRAPITEPSSALEFRANCTYTKANGTGQVFIPPQIIGPMVENEEPEDWT